MEGMCMSRWGWGILGPGLSTGPLSGSGGLDLPGPVQADLLAQFCTHIRDHLAPGFNYSLLLPPCLAPSLSLEAFRACPGEAKSMARETSTYEALRLSMKVFLGPGLSPGCPEWGGLTVLK